MAIWTNEINDLDVLYKSFKGHMPDIVKEMEQLIRTDDPNVIMLYSRRCLEVIITDLCECELKRPRKTEPLKGIIDKLNSEEKVPSHIITSMLGLNSMANYGAHPKDFDPEQVKPVLNNLAIIIKWYLKYKDFQIVSKTKPEEEKNESKVQEKSVEVVTPSKKRSMHWTIKVLLGLAVAFIALLLLVPLYRKNIINRHYTEAKAVGYVADLIDDQIYKRINIGNQVWMGENLKAMHLNDKTPISLVTDDNIWANLETPACCWYKNNENKYAKSSYGLLYNWYAVNTGKLCPTGWHVPTDAEWTILLQYVGGEENAGDALKETGQAHWRMNYNEATNTSGFSATGGGNRNMYGPFEEIRSRGYFWSASDYPDYVNYPMSINLFSNASNVLSSSMDKKFGMSVRCIEDHYITDYDNNKYNTVQIGSQIWMTENLRTTHFNDGSPIPLVKDNEEWNNLQTPAFCWCDSSSVNGDNFYSALWNVSGALYNWHTLNTGKLCPAGWHIPEDSEWKSLIDYLGGESAAGDKLKTTVFWSGIANTEPTATNESGFSALPCGYRSANGWYDGMGDSGKWWCSSEYPENSAFDALYRYMGYESSIVKNTFINKSSGLSVRCVKD